MFCPDEFLTTDDYEILTTNTSDNLRYPLVIKDNFISQESSCYDEFMQLQTETNLLQPSRMGGQDNNWQSKLFRGDRTCWITPSLCAERKMVGVQSIVKGMIKICSNLRQFSLEPLALKDFSVQYAVYPGNDTGYTRHLDAIKVEDCSETRRQITLICYVHKEEVIGGQLRVFLPYSGEEPQYLDIDATPSRLIIFQSEVLEHEVLPTKSTRMALTMWASGCGHFGPNISNRFSRSISERTSQFSLPQRQQITTTWENTPTHLEDAHQDNSTLSINRTSRESAESIESIFISIASFRDSELKYTLRDIFQQAQHPSRIFVGVVLQIYDTEEDQHLYGFNQIYTSSFFSSSFDYLAISSLLHTNIRVLQLNALESRGPCWARSLAQSLWKDEQYYLQIDSHMRFRKDYDSYLIQIHSQCEEILLTENNSSSSSIFPVISTYPQGYQLNNPLPLTDIRSTILVPSFFDGNGILRQKARVMKGISVTPVKTYLWAAGFSFTKSKVVMEIVPYDPHLEYLFFGEEISMAARLFTHGGVIFTPPQSIIYHLWSRDHRPPPSPESEEEKERKRRGQIKSQQLVLDLLRERGGHNQPYGLGSIRTIEEFEQLLNVSFQKMKVYDQSTYSDSIFALDPFEIGDSSASPSFSSSPSSSSSSQATNKSMIQKKNIEIFNIVQSFLS